MTWQVLFKYCSHSVNFLWCSWDLAMDVLKIGSLFLPLIAQIYSGPSKVSKRFKHSKIRIFFLFLYFACYIKYKYIPWLACFLVITLNLSQFSHTHTGVYVVLYMLYFYYTAKRNVSQCLWWRMLVAMKCLVAIQNQHQYSFLLLVLTNVAV